MVSLDGACGQEDCLWPAICGLTLHLPHQEIGRILWVTELSLPPRLPSFLALQLCSSCPRVGQTVPCPGLPKHFSGCLVTPLHRELSRDTAIPWPMMLLALECPTPSLHTISCLLAKFLPHGSLGNQWRDDGSCSQSLDATPLQTG